MMHQLEITRLSDSSWFKLTYQKKVIHIDPGYFGYFDSLGVDPKHLKEQADYLFVSHVHQDHIRKETIDRLIKPETQIIASLSCINDLPTNAQLVRPNTHIDLGLFSVDTLYAYNTEAGHSTKKFHQRDIFLGFLFHIGGKTLYFAGDTDVIPEMHDLGDIDIAFLPIGGTYVMDLGESLEATSIINPKIVIPMHQSSTDLNAFADKLKSKTTECVVLHINDSFTY